MANFQVTNTTPALQLVTPTILSNQSIANQAIVDATTFLNQILNFSANTTLQPITVTLPQNLTVASNYNTPSVPIPPNLSIVLPNLPATYVPGNVRTVNLNQIGAIPAFNIPQPTVTLPGKPNPLTATPPSSAPTINTTVSLPNRPSTTLPPVPTLTQLNLPTLQTISIPSFTATLPSAVGITPPSLTFNWTENPYSSTLLTALKNELLNRITNGGTGLNPVVEQAIFNRGRDREKKESLSVQENILKEQSARGWSRPSGSVIASLELAVVDAQNKISELNRNIIIQQAELEQKNLEFALQTALSLEQTLVQENNNIMERAFQAQQFIQQTAIEIYNARIAQLNTELEVYKAFSTAYEARIRAELTKVEIYKSEIEAQSLISDLNKDQIQLYLGRIEGVKADAEVYKTIVDSVNTQLQAEGLKLDLFRSQIDNYAAQVEAKKNEFIAYGEEIKGEQLKADVFNSQVQAFISRVEAYGKQVDAQSAVAQSDINFEEIRLRQYLGQLDAVIKQTQAKTEAFRANVDVFSGQTQLFNAQVGAESARLGVELKQIENNILNSRAIADIALQNAQIQIQNAQSVDELFLESLKAGANAYISLANSSLSALNIGASISGNVSDSVSQQFITNL